MAVAATAAPLASPPAPAISLLADTPTQVFSLVKLLRGFGDAHGDFLDEAFSTNLSSLHGRRVIVDCGLHLCEALAAAVNHGYIVHGFEPVPDHMANCHRLLKPTQYMDVDVSSKASLMHARAYGRKLAQALRPAAAPAPRASSSNESSTSSSHQQQQHEHLRHNNNPHFRGFAFLYQAAVGNESGLTTTIKVHGGSTKLGTAADGTSASCAELPTTPNVYTSAPGGKMRPYCTNVTTVRIDDVVQEDLWLLKMDLQGYEWHALDGAARLFQRHTVAHVFTEFTPRLLRDAGVNPRAVLDTLKSYGMICFDTRNGDGPRFGRTAADVAAPWALPRDHPLEVDEYLDAMKANDEQGAHRNEVGRHGFMAIWMRRYGSFDDLACVNVAKAWSALAGDADGGESR